MLTDFLRLYYKTETSVVQAGKEVFYSLALLNILAVFLGIIYFLNPYIIVKVIEKKYGKKK